MRLDQETKQEMSRQIEWALKSADAKVTGFSEAMEMRHGSKVDGGPWTEYVEYLIPVHLQTDRGEAELTVSDRHLENSVWSAVQAACHEFPYEQKYEWETMEKILERIYTTPE